MTASIQLTPEKAMLAEEILADGYIDDAEAMRIRREVFQGSVADTEEVELIFYLDANGGGDKAWAELFIETLSDFFVRKQFPPGILCQEDADYFVRRVTSDGKIGGRIEFDLLVNIIEKAWLCPENVVALAIDVAKEAVLAGGGKLFGPERRRQGVLDKADVDDIRKLVYGTGGGGGYTVTRGEAEMLFNLNNAVIEKENDPSWRDLFVKSVGSYLMFPRQAPSVDEYIRCQTWLAERKGTREFIKEIGKSLIDGRGLKEAFDMAASLIPGMVTNEEREKMARLAEEEDIAERLAQVDEAEASWLMGQIAAAGVVHENERALLAFIKKTATTCHPSMDPLFAQAGV